MPYSITCGVYGLMAHTAFAGGKSEVMHKYEKMKEELQRFIDSDYTDDAGEWCEKFANKW